MPTGLEMVPGLLGSFGNSLGSAARQELYILCTLCLLFISCIIEFRKNVATYFPLQCRAGFMNLTKSYKVACVGVNPLLTRNASFTKTVILALRIFLVVSAS